MNHEQQNNSNNNNNYFDMKTQDNISDHEHELSAAEKKRFRITRACDYCRKKKVKCYFTPGQSCSNCISYGITCEFNDGAKKRGPPKGYIDALEKRIRKIEESLQNTASQQQTTVTNSQLAGSPSTINSPSSPHIHHQHRHTHSESTPQSLVNTNTGNKRPQGASTDGVQYLGDMSSFQFFSNKMQLNDQNTKWKGHRIRKFGKQVVLVEDNEDEENHAEIPQSLILSHLKPIHYWIYSVTGVDRHTSDRLLKIYFANIHPVLPVVNKTRFLKQYRDQADTYPPSDLLNAMFGAAARFVECEALEQKSKPNRPPDAVWDVPIGWSDQFFEQAQSIITTSAVDPTISKVQSIILIHNHSGNLGSKSSATWLLGGMAIRLAQGLGLNRDCEEWDIPESEKQTRKRIWWSLYVADRFQSASLGRPISIRDEDNDVAYPDSTASWKEVLDEPDQDELNASVNGSTEISMTRFPSAMCKPKQSDGRVGIYQLFIELVKLSEILGRILQGLYTPKAKKVGLVQGSDAIVTQLDHQLTEWRFGFPEALQKADFEDFDESKGYLAPVTASVLLCYFSLLILLHRPFIEATVASGKKPRSSYSSFRIGTSAATRGIRIASQMTIRDFLMFPYSFSLYPVLQCCLILMYNTKNLDARISAPAKADLTKGLQLMSKLRAMSSTARRLYGLLRTIMDNKEIEVPVPASDSEESIKSRDNSIDSTTIPSRVSDVGRGGNSMRSNSGHSHPQQQQQQGIIQHPPSTPRSSTAQQQQQHAITQSPKEQHYPIRHFQQSLADVIAAPNMASHPNIDGSASVSSAPSPTSMSEAFSLKQFGFNNTIGDPNQLDYTMQDVSAFSGMETLPPMPTTIYNQTFQQPVQQMHNNNSPQQQRSLQQQLNIDSYVPSSNASQFQAPQQPINATMPIQQQQQQQQNMIVQQIGVFRNNPNNPFFGIPSSMDWTEWNEWNQNNQGNATWKPLA